MKWLMVAILLPLCLTAKSQVSVDILSIVQNSNRFTFIGITYQPDEYLFTPNYGNMADGLAALQARYDAAHRLCSHEYQKLLQLSLVNDNNSAILNNYRQAVVDWGKTNFRKMDLAQPSIKNSVLEFITRVYTVQSVRNELSILNELNGFIEAINSATITESCKSSAFKIINAFIEKLKHSSQEELALGFQSLYQQTVNEFNSQKAKENLIQKTTIESRYRAFQTFTKVEEGWHDIGMISVGDVRMMNNFMLRVAKPGKVYVSGNRISMIMSKDGSVKTVNASPQIVKRKVDVVIDSELCDGSVNSIPYTIYFVNL